MTKIVLTTTEDGSTRYDESSFLKLIVASTKMAHHVSFKGALTASEIETLVGRLVDLGLTSVQLVVDGATRDDTSYLSRKQQD